MKPNKFFEVFEITVISGSLILIFFLFFFKEQKLTVLIYSAICKKELELMVLLKFKEPPKRAVWDL